MTPTQLEEALNGSPFQRLLGVRVESVDSAAKLIRLRCPQAACMERAEGSGQFHGGVIASLIDIAGDYALFALLGHGVPTINLRVDYLRRAVQTDLLACAQVRRAGQRVAVVDVEITDCAGQLVALGRGCYSTDQS